MAREAAKGGFRSLGFWRHLHYHEKLRGHTESRGSLREVHRLHRQNGVEEGFLSHMGQDNLQYLTTELHLYVICGAEGVQQQKL